MKDYLMWTGVAILSLGLLMGAYFLTATPPHCGQWQTIRQITEPYDEYVWNSLYQRMVPQHHPEQTYLSLSYCSEPAK